MKKINQTPDDRFDEKFYNVGDGVGGRWLNGTPDEIKSFLHSEIDLAVKEYQEEANEMIEQARIDALEQAAKAVEGMKKEEKACAYCLDTHWMKVNQGRGKMKDMPCVWCRDGKNKLAPEQLVSFNENVNIALTSAADIIRKLKSK